MLDNFQKKERLSEQLSPEDSRSALTSLERYLSVAIQIIEENDAQRGSGIDILGDAPTMKERSIENLKT